MLSRFRTAGAITVASLTLFGAGCGRTSSTEKKFAVLFTSDIAPPTADHASRSVAVWQPQGEPPDASSPLVGRIVGVVRWSGPLPELDPILVNKDVHVCAEHGRHDRPPEQLIVNSSVGGIKDAVVQLVGNFEDAKPLAELSHPDTLDQRQCAYEPRVFVLPVGARLIMTSEDDVGHNVHMTGAADLNIVVSKGGRTSRRFERAGLVKLGCDIHPWMTGYIHVVKHPYYAVSDAEGKFELTDVPVGTHQIRLWHEAWWTEEGKVVDPIVVTQSVSVRAGETTRVTFEFTDPAWTRVAGGGSVEAKSKQMR